MKVFPPILLLIGLLLASLIQVRAQEFAFVQFNQNEGLYHSQVLDIAQDANGNLWIGTATRSVYRFDGRLFYEYKITLPDNTGTLYTLKVQPDSNGVIWILSNLGLIRFDGVKSRLVPVNGDVAAGTKSQLFKDTNEVPWLIDDKGKVFRIKNDTLAQQDQLQVTGKISGYYQNQEGTLCLFSDQGEVLQINESSEATVAHLPEGIEGTVSSVYRQGENYWVATSMGIWSYKTPENKVTKIFGSPGKGKISKLVLDKEGLIWGLMANQVFVLDKDMTLYWISDFGLDKNDVVYLYRDYQGGIWISIDLMGIVKYKKRTWIKIPETAGKDITSITKRPDNNRLVFGTYAEGILGLGRETMVGKPITSMDWKPNGNLLAGTLKDGLFEIDSRSARSIPLANIPYMDVYGVRAWGDRAVAGAYSGLFVVDAQGKVKKYGRSGGKIVDTSNPIVINDTIYFTGMSAGLMRIQGDTIANVGPDFLKNNSVYTLRKQKNGEYIVTGEFGQVLFFDKNFTFQRSLDVTSFASNVLLAEFIDPRHMIIGSNDGLFKVTLEDDSVQSVKKYGKVDGYEGEELYVGASVQEGNDIVIGTVSGAYRYKMKNEENDLALPITYITGIDFFEDETIVDRSGYFQLPVNPTLKHDKNSITFSFSASNLSNPDNIHFHQRLKGVDEEWSPVSSSQQVTYSNLDPGTYTFMVQAISESRIAGNTATYVFSVEPAFWQTSFFYFIVVIVIVALVAAIIWSVSAYRVNQHKKEEQVRALEAIRIRKQMSMDFHDEMGNKLAGMLAQASLLKLKHKDTELSKTFDFFERNAYAIYHGTKDFIWTIDVKSNNWKEVISYLRDFGFGFFERNQINFHVQNYSLDERFDHQLPDGVNRQVILIFKEAMTNSLKHSACKNVYFSTNMEGDTFKISFADDGAWNIENTRGNGITNMNKRAEKINARLVIERQQGTKVTLFVKK